MYRSEDTHLRSMGRSWPRFRKATLGAGLLFVCTFLSTLVLYRWSNPGKRNITPLFKLADHTCDAFQRKSTNAGSNEAEIPNIVHYVWLLEDPETFALDFKAFVTIYSSHLFFDPDHIYIHTDASPATFERAKSGGDTWMKRILAILKVEPNYVTTVCRDSAFYPSFSIPFGPFGMSRA